MNTATQYRHSTAATKNACKLCAPLGASLVFKGIENAVPLLHGSQGCSTYIRRYLISHFKEPMDIACSNFAENTAIFGGAVNLKLALDNIRCQYGPALVGVATTCLSETIGDDVPMFVHEYRRAHPGEPLPAIVHVSTPSYQGTHMQGFHRAVLATVTALAEGASTADGPVVLFPGMVSCADLRHLKEILADFDLPVTLLPDYSQTLDGPLWTEYHRIPPGGTPVQRIREIGAGRAVIELGRVLAMETETAGKYVNRRFGVPHHAIGLPMGIHETDALFQALEVVSGKATPEKHAEERGRLIDSLVDGHKYVSGRTAAVFGEEDWVVGMAAFLSEIGIIPVLCASGDRSGHLETALKAVLPSHIVPKVMSGGDFVDIEAAATERRPDLLVGSSKGYTLSRRIGVPLIRIGFPIHDRIGGSRQLHLGYRGAQSLFDRIANTIIEQRQGDSAVGYTYM